MNESALWVDSDFGFDDLWALLVLRHLGVDVAGVSLVCGNMHLQQVINNAVSAQQVFGFRWPLFAGAQRPLKLPLHTAEAVLGQQGMQTRGLKLPHVKPSLQPNRAVGAFSQWLASDQGKHEVLALGPLTNLAHHCLRSPDVFRTIDKITWMGGSAGHGNQTAWAEFNAYVDPDAVDVVLSAGVPVDIVDLELCRQVIFGESDITKFRQDAKFDQNHRTAQLLLKDLLGGYLDIALCRGRESMAIYDPIAALAIADVAAVEFTPSAIEVRLPPDEQRGRTTFTLELTSGDNTDSRSDPSSSPIRLATRIDCEAARTNCMAALQLPV